MPSQRPVLFPVAVRAKILSALGEGSAALATEASLDRWHLPLGLIFFTERGLGLGTPRRSARALLECQGQGDTQGGMKGSGAAVDEMRQLSAAFFGQSRQASTLVARTSAMPQPRQSSGSAFCMVLLRPGVGSDQNPESANKG